MLQKLKRIALSAVVLLTCLAPVAVSQVGFAASGPCPGSDAPYPAVCSKIPLGCPGSSKQGPVSSSVSLTCPWNPTTTFTCRAKKCTFPKVASLNNGQTYSPSGGGGTGPCPGSDAPYPVDCSKIPLGCPGSSLQGPVNPAITLKCPYNPTSTFTCQAKQCTFPSSSTLTNGQTYNPSGGGGGGGGGSGNCSTLSKCDLITQYINPFINFLAALVGVAVVISIIIGGIQYGSSAGDPQKVSAAKNRIRNAIVALVTFLFLYALLNFLMPGGLV